MNDYEDAIMVYVAIMVLGIVFSVLHFMGVV